jgi:NAD(P)-dependent dehydrogenase (short-subunit alcohol dehydrogenase family)
MRNIDLRGKVGVVTGSTRGIGRAIAEELGRSGATVVLSGRREEDVARVVEEMKAAGHRATGAACDVRRYDQVEQLMGVAAREAGGIDVLINNAGIGLFAHVAEIDPGAWDEVIQTNLTGVFYCSRAAIPYFRKRGGGVIVNVSSLAGKNAFAGGAAYNASKFGLEGLSEAMMLDLRYENIKVAYVMPGSVATEFSGRAPEEDSWRLTGTDVAEVVLDILAQDRRALASRIELRPFQPPRKP